MLGKACVVTDCDGNRDLVKDNHNGFLVPMENIIEMAKKAERLYNDSKLLAVFEKNAKHVFENDFNMRKNIKQLEAIYSREITE